MSLVPGAIKAQIVTALTTLSGQQYPTTADAILDFGQKFEDIIYAAIKSATITAPLSTINVVETVSPNAPSTNIAPIILNNSIT